MLPVRLICLNLIWLLGLLALGQVQSAAFQLPLTKTEIRSAITIALNTLPQNALAIAPSRQLPTENPTRTKPLRLGIETLFVENQIQKNQGDTSKRHRTANVYLYDYINELSVYITVDLLTQKTIRSQILNTHHLPLSSNERQFARDLLQQDAQFQARLATAVTSAGDSTMFESGKLRSKVSIFQPDSSQTNKRALCNRHRCAQVTYTTTDLISLPLEPIVVLATGQILLSPPSPR